MTPTPTDRPAVQTLDDQFGYQLTLLGAPDAEAARAAWDETALAFLAHGAATPVHLTAALTNAPRFPLALAAKGFFMLLLGRPELRGAALEARAAIAAELEAGAPLTARERAAKEALDLYVAGRLSAAADRLDAALADHPRDALLMKLVHAIRFVLGDAAGMRRSIEAALPAFEGAHPARAFALGCHAFALEETGAYVAAERAGRQAVTLAPHDAWGLHAVAHVMDMTGRSGDGVSWLAGRDAGWRHCNNFGYHIWWHLALFHLDRGEIDAVLRLYDEEIRKDHTDDYRDISNGASLLARLEFEGIDVGDRWEELAALSENRVEDGCVVFADLHYLLALNGAGRELAGRKMLATMREAATRRIGDMGAVAAEAGAPAAEGLFAFAHGDYAAAYARLAEAHPAMPKIGGSHAQRDVFDRLTIEAALRAGLLSEARRCIQDRARRRGALDAYAETRLERIARLQDEARGVA